MVQIIRGGRMGLEGRRMTTVDEARPARDAAPAAERLAPVNADARSLAERLEGAVGRHGLARSREDDHVERHARGTT